MFAGQFLVNMAPLRIDYEVTWSVTLRISSQIRHHCYYFERTQHRAGKIVKGSYTMSSPSPGKRRMDTDVVKLYPCLFGVTEWTPRWSNQCDCDDRARNDSRCFCSPVLHMWPQNHLAYIYRMITYQLSGNLPVVHSNIIFIHRDTSWLFYMLSVS